MLTDVAQDPFGWRAAIGKGTPIRAITGIAVDNIDAFADDVGMTAVAFPTPARLDEGFYGGFWLGRWDARNVLMFVGADRTADEADDLVRMHLAARQHKRLRVMQAAAGDWPPYTALDMWPGLTARSTQPTSGPRFTSITPAASACSTGCWPGRSPTGPSNRHPAVARRPGTSRWSTKAIAGYAPGETIGLQGLDLERTVLDRHRRHRPRGGGHARAGRAARRPDVADWADACGSTPLEQLSSSTLAARAAHAADVREVDRLRGGTDPPGDSVKNTEPDRPGIRVACERPQRRGTP